MAQVVERAQARTIALALAWARGRVIDGERTIPEALAAIVDAVARDGFDLVQEEPTGEPAGFRGFELAAALARIRALETRPAG